MFVIHALSPIPQSGDSRLSAITGWQFLHHFSLDLGQYPQIAALTEQGDIVTVGARQLPFFPWPPMLLSIPADVLVALFSAGPGVPQAFFPGHTFAVEVPTAALLVAVTTVLLLDLLRTLPTELVGRRAAMLTALLFAFGTSAWSVGSRALWQQTVSMLIITAALLTLQRLRPGSGRPLVLGLLTALAVVVRPTNAVIAVLLLALLCWRYRPMIIRFVSGAVLVLVPFLLYSRWQYGTFLPPYYQLSRLSDPVRYGFGESILVNLVSPSRGLLFFDPVIVLAVIGVVLRTRRRVITPIDVFMMVAVFGQLILIAKYGSTGGYTYGPRLMIDVLPMLMVLAAPTLAPLCRRSDTEKQTARRLVVAGLVVLLAWSVFVNASGALSRAGVCWNSDPVSVDVEPQRVWDLSDPQFLRPTRAVFTGESLHDVVLAHCKANP